MRKIILLIALMFLTCLAEAKSNATKFNSKSALSSDNVMSKVNELPQSFRQTSKTDDLPNLEIFTYADWSAPLLFNHAPDVNTGEFEFLNTDIFFMSLSYANTTDTPTGSFFVMVLMDGTDTLWSRQVESTIANCSYGFLNIPVARLEIGNHTLELIVDTQNEVEESDETDNIYTVQITVLNDPDGFVNLAPQLDAGWVTPLFLSHFMGAIQPDFVFYNSRDIYLNLCFGNNGNLPCDSFHYMVIIESYDTIWSFDMGPIQPDWIRGINDENIGRFPPGDYTLTMVLDSENAIPESDENDNQISVDFTVFYDPGDLPNIDAFTPPEWDAPLIISNSVDAGTSMDEVLQSDNLFIGFGCSNPDELPVGPFNVSVVLNDTEVLATRSLPELLPDRFHYWPNIEIGSLDPGEYTLSLKVDADNDVPETDEEDNLYSFSFTVNYDVALMANLTPNVIPGTDAPLILSNAEEAASSITEFLTTDVVYISFSLQNNSNNPAGQFVASILKNNSDTLATQHIVGLEAGTSIDWKDINIGMLGPGEYTLSLLIDPDNRVMEQDETDNNYSISFSVSEPLATSVLLVKDVKIWPNPATNGIRIEFVNDTSCEIELINLCGEKLLHRSANKLSALNLNINKIPEGIHLLKITGHEFSLVQKIVVRK
ncbi:MAG: T9SS type A sorting domain-containing protein [Prolixibacteraceae bacterium]|nr:T9SS type A sorting domain-containing protein [Prolixibacteraceae bacterium]